ncbi:hypothetical protein IAQ61_010913 [Plenodomus lingam]|uniref:uncharacterized protein n=1 Tax=Leptosphaeria maculans TaxID=5022 RepID=UPI0033297F4A|nr:hypothetical protein IAQ61_010913 [Plenodomus lingam]
MDDETFVVEKVENVEDGEDQEFPATWGYGREDVCEGCAMVIEKIMELFQVVREANPTRAGQSGLKLCNLPHIIEDSSCDFCRFLRRVAVRKQPSVRIADLTFGQYTKTGIALPLGRPVIMEQLKYEVTPSIFASSKALPSQVETGIAMPWGRLPVVPRAQLKDKLTRSISHPSKHDLRR